MWHQKLINLPTSSVSCSHFTLWNPKKVIFNNTTDTYFWLFANSVASSKQQAHQPKFSQNCHNCFFQPHFHFSHLLSTGLSINKYVHIQGLTYIHTCQSYIHMPRDFTNSASLAWCLHQRISTVMFTCGWAWPARSPICPILGFWGSKIPKNGRFPALDANKLPCKIWRC